MGTAQVLGDFYGRCAPGAQVAPELVAALDDPQPWADLPDIVLPAALMHRAWLARNYDFTIVQRARLWRLGRLNQALEYLLAEVRHDASDIEAYRHAATFAGFSDEVQLRFMLLDWGISLEWISDARFQTLAEAWADQAPAIVGAVRGKLNGSKLGSDARAVAMEMMIRLDPRPKGWEEALRLVALTATTDAVRGRAKNRVVVDATLVPWVAARLSGGTALRRSQAALWLAELAGAAAIEPIKAQAAKERSEEVRVVQLRALESLGVPPDQVLDRDLLAAELHKAAKKGTQPDGYERGLLPELRWRDGTVVEDAIVDAWIRTCHKRKKAEPTPMLVVLAMGVDPVSGSDFAMAVLRWWLALDEPAVPDPMGREGGLGAAHRGLLALVAALGDERLLEPSEHYLKSWYGWRSSQCKGLLTMLAHIDSRAATQYIIRIATRFRTAGIKKHAQAELDALAARRGWTPDELADRTLDDGGLGADGVVHLDYLRGDQLSRRFVLSMTPAMTLQITHEGTTVKGLPKPRVDEDPDSVKAAKKQLTRSRKAFKTFLKGQTARLHAALVSQRAWPAPLFKEVVLAHPVLGELARRLVWVRDDGVSFRPMEDGSCCDLDDEGVTLDDGHTVRLAHGLVDDHGPAWGDHFTDYELLSPLDQFGRPTWRPDAAVLEGQAIDGFRGTVVGALQVRGRAVKLGYDLQTGDGGYIDFVYKEFRSLEITVKISVEGLRHPVEDMEVTLGEAEFERGGRVVALSGVPAVLRSEIHADMAELASMVRT